MYRSNIRNLDSESLPVCLKLSNNYKNDDISDKEEEDDDDDEYDYEENADVVVDTTLGKPHFLIDTTHCGNISAISYVSHNQNNGMHRKDKGFTFGSGHTYIYSATTPTSSTFNVKSNRPLSIDQNNDISALIVLPQKTALQIQNQQSLLRRKLSESKSTKQEKFCE